MSAGLAEAIRAVVQDKGISEELLIKVIEEFLIAAYKRKFGQADNAVVQFTDEGNEVTLFAQKRIVTEVEDPVTEIILSEALELNDECEVGDELLIEINPQEFDRVSIQSAKQKARQRIREIQKDTLYSEFSEKVGELVIGYVQRERNGNLFIDLGRAEGILPKRYQSPREVYRTNDRLKALIVDVAKGNSGLQIALSRTHTDLVKRIFELEVPEIYGKTVEIVRIVREAGYRTKIAVASNREDVDPVGACVGLRGVRIQAIVRELEGEKIDILKYDPDPRILIKNALSPAEVTNVVVIDEARRQALAIVPEDQLSLAIGKQGLNVRLANRLADWNIDVKTMDQFDEMDIAAESKRAVSALFSDIEEPEDEITSVAELPGITDEMVRILAENNITMIEEIVGLSDEEIHALAGMKDDIAVELSRIIADNVEIVEQDEEFVSGDTDEEYEAADEDDRPDPEEESVEKDEDEGEDEEEIITEISELPGMTDSIVERLKGADISDLEELIALDPQEIAAIEGLTKDEQATIRTILTEYVEIVEGDEEEGE
ncbi:MAG: transcription termination factor NusA [Spirochaetales bacterium]|nr:transcription termination factor NusA [Spirochaetales bacterium]